MKRIKIVGLCLFIACAFAAMAGVSTASATVDQGICVAKKGGKYENAGCSIVAKKKGSKEFVSADSCYNVGKGGNYTEGKCATVAEKCKKGKCSPDHKGAWELAPSPTFTTSTGKATLNTPGSGAIECTSSAGSGVITGNTTSIEQVIFKGCTTKGHACFNAVVGGEPVIETFPLEVTLEENAAHEAVNHLENAHQTGAPFSSEFECAEVTAIRTKGFTDGIITSPLNTVSTSQSVSFSGELNLKTEFVLGLNGKGEPEWSGGTGGGPNEFGPFGEFPSEENTAATVTLSTALEVQKL